jgi:hypothetical protein
MAENKEKSSLSLKQQKALSALIAQPTIGLAAAASGVGERTIYLWLSSDANFQAEFRKVKAEIVSNAMYQLQKATNNAVNVALSLMNDPETPASTRLGAARLVLEMALESVKLEALEARIEALEQAQQHREQQRSQNGHTGY